MLPNVVGSVPVSLPPTMSDIVDLCDVHNVILIFAFHAPRAPTGRRKGSENVAQVKKLKRMQAELKILVRDCEG